MRGFLGFFGDINGFGRCRFEKGGWVKLGGKKGRLPTFSMLCSCVSWLVCWLCMNQGLRIRVCRP